MYPPQQQSPPLHLLPVPRPIPPGVVSAAVEGIYVAWMVIFLLLGAFSAYYSLAVAHYHDDTLGAAMASAAFFVLAIPFALRWMIRLQRYRRIIAYGRAVPGGVLEVTRLVFTNRQLQATGATWCTVVVGFEDKQVSLPHILDPPENPAVFVDGQWAAIYIPAYVNARGPVAAGIRIAKWTPRRA